MKIFTIIGARPQFIKAAVVSRAFKEHRTDVCEILVHTGQHYDSNMSDIFFEELDIPHPKYNLGIGGGTHGQNTGRMIEQLEVLMLKEKPDWILIYGDTDSTLAGAIAASKLHIPVAHVEAGLRSYNRRMPEEINRVMADHISTQLFSPTKLAQTNLLREGVASGKIHVVGDVMYDAAMFYKDRSKAPEWFDSAKICKNKFVLCTVHRAENTDDPLRMTEILKGLEDCGLDVIFPVHPRTQKKLSEFNIYIPSNVQFFEPAGYLEMVWLERNCTVIATDSGGVQKEAYFHMKPCVTLRDETEWAELVELGVNVLAGANRQEIADAIRKASSHPIQEFSNIYGAGDAGEIIVSLLK